MDSDFYFEDIGGGIEDRVRSLLDQAIGRAAELGSGQTEALLALADELYTAIDDIVEVNWPGGEDR